MRVHRLVIKIYLLQLSDHIVNVSLSYLRQLIILNFVGEIDAILREFGILGDLIADEIHVFFREAAEEDGLEMGKLLIWDLVDGRHQEHLLLENCCPRVHHGNHH